MTGRWPYGRNKEACRPRYVILTSAFAQIMAWATEQTNNRHMQIQELGYKITVALNSDARSEVEGLRWVLTRRAAITLGISAFLLFVGLRYMSYIQHHLQEEKKQKPPSQPPHRPSPLEDLADSPSSSASSPLGHQQPIGGELLATEGVSLG